MAFRIFMKRCDECGNTYQMRKPTRAIFNRPTFLQKVLDAMFCPHCHPERLEDVCPSCLLPWTIVKKHANGLCNTCVVSIHRASLQPAAAR